MSRAIAHHLVSVVVGVVVERSEVGGSRNFGNANKRCNRENENLADDERSCHSDDEVEEKGHHCGSP